MSHFTQGKREKKRRASEASLDGRSESSTFVDTLYFCFIGLLMAVAISKMVTGNWFFGYERSRWMRLRTWMPSQNITMTPEELLKYDGTDPTLPLYLAVNGQIFDVSEGKRIYAPGGSYHIFAGKDCARGYATGCFKQDCTYDLRGLSDNDVKKVEGWQKFYNKHDKYFRVGTLLNPPIDPDSPEPAPCGKRDK